MTIAVQINKYPFGIDRRMPTSTPQEGQAFLCEIRQPIATFTYLGFGQRPSDERIKYIREFDKDAVWREASSINGVFTNYGLGLTLAQRGGIVDLGRRVRITDQGANRPENRPPDGLYLRDRSYLGP